ncbi:MAG: hypothetical protein IPJ47_12835 [Anaerolineales bacterium]|nr:hypothetical protein [Anaerolineales bacterium]
MGIGPMGFGGKTTVLDPRSSVCCLPASHLSSIFMCWAYRRKLTVRATRRA